MNKFRLFSLPVLVSAVVVGAWPAAAFAATDPFAGSSVGNFAVLAGTTVTNTGPSLVTGQLGVSPGSSVTGFPPGSSGPQHKA
ncbi:MAG: ice-binding family protein, partial [Candidatus Dormibacteraeota bacterium]|nr:ice-binding family protein [Candidatus Dormibacteraeota bacterium]